jgi:hypothetical protein
MGCIKVVDKIETSSQQSQARNMIDGSDDTCWFSSHGGAQRVTLHLKKRVPVLSLTVLFQSGFQCKKGRVLFGDRSVDVGCRKDQSSFTLSIEAEAEKLEVLLDESYDLYGRYCVYKMEVAIGKSSALWE